MSKFKIAIFAGHYPFMFKNEGSKGIKTNLTNNGIYEEYDSNYFIAEEIVDILKEYDDVKVLFPQRGHKVFSLSQRVSYCNDNKVDFAVFVHSNASSNKSASGACAFYWGNSIEGKKFADIYAKKFKEEGYPLWSNGTYPCQTSGWSNFYVVRNTNMPVALTENFFFTNPNELKKYLLDEKELKNIAKLHAESVLDYFNINKKQSDDKDTHTVEAPDSKVESIHTDKPSRNYLKKGDKGNKVKSVQKRLIKAGYDLSKYGADGDYGSETEAAVKAMQKKNGIAVDGLFGQESESALDKELKNKNNKKSNSSKSNLKVDGKWGKSTTRAIQKSLKTPVDGIISSQPRNHVTEAIYSGVKFGSKGSPMVKALQKKVGAKQDGKLGSKTIRKLQKYLGTVQDGKISRPSSMMVKEMQRRLNNGSF